MSRMLVVRRLYATGGPWGTGEGFTVLEFTAEGARVAVATYRTEKLAWAALRAERERCRLPRAPLPSLERSVRRERLLLIVAILAGVALMLVPALLPT